MEPGHPVVAVCASKYYPVCALCSYVNVFLSSARANCATEENDHVFIKKTTSFRSLMGFIVTVSCQPRRHLGINHSYWSLTPWPDLFRKCPRCNSWFLFDITKKSFFPVRSDFCDLKFISTWLQNLTNGFGQVLLFKEIPLVVGYNYILAKIN